jgi:carbon-monoxide dehydrogenase small subunit
MAGAERLPVTLGVNGNRVEIEVEANELLVDMLRDRLCLPGTHIGCRTGDCGACTVLIDGSARKACLQLAVRSNGHEITTIEGLSGEDGELHPLQTAFWDEYGFQCGFCTAGMILAGADLLARNPLPDEEAIRDAISGNLCRCTGYEPIVLAIARAAEKIASVGSDR